LLYGRNHATREAADEKGDFDRQERAVSRWRATALFGGLILLEGVFVVAEFQLWGSYNTFALFLIGILLFPFGWVIASVLGVDYFLAVAGAGGIALGYFFFSINGWTSEFMTPWHVLTFFIAGLACLSLGIVRSIQLTKLIEKE